MLKNSSSWLLFNQCYWEEKKQAALMSSKAQMDIFIFFRATAATAAWLVLEAKNHFVWPTVTIGQTFTKYHFSQVSIFI